MSQFYDEWSPIQGVSGSEVIVLDTIALSSLGYAAAKANAARISVVGKAVNDSRSVEYTLNPDLPEIRMFLDDGDVLELTNVEQLRNFRALGTVADVKIIIQYFRV